MVSHVKKPGVGPSQDPKAPRKTSKPKPNAKPRTRIRSRTSKCMHCRQRRVMCNGFKQTCVRCAKDVVLELQPQCMDVDSGFGNAEGNLPAPVEIWTADPMQIDSGSGSNDVDPVPHSEPNAPSTLAVAPEMGGEQQSAGDATAPSREHTLPFSFQGQPWSGAPTPSFLSGITPWTPMDSSTFTSLQPFMLPPENTSYEASMASAVDTNPPATPNHATDNRPSTYGFY
ncbi:hypothetical protein BBK36DRAFT_1174218 [Trichoderma citrinoviride]|uniref:Zn(2)-C6 fungal-type domain-containing protein n=1 Tax=Trichoderma citrinoviride TaxID=58853 RepID=A0A2T4BM84_9HYPO|nr:hypothetical protein BBK36DRAFT_1174218 [Trichoderma citrinoviride]PTB70425.1 hypothetical protein BBK36DRAFT_1174218 [Trichoderma citrinoviride]